MQNNLHAKYTSTTSFAPPIPWILHEWKLPLNTLRPRRNGQHFTDDIFKGIFLNENVWILIKLSLFFPKDRINNIPALVQIMAWRRRGDKPLSEPIMVSLPTHICVTRPQRVNRKTMEAFGAISYSRFPHADTHFMHTQHRNPKHVRPKDKGRIAVLSVDEFTYPLKQKG